MMSTLFKIMAGVLLGAYIGDKGVQAWNKPKIRELEDQVMEIEFEIAMLENDHSSAIDTHRDDRILKLQEKKRILKRRISDLESETLF